jgi:triosephosphate isomerase
MKRLMIAGNWKMHKTVHEAVAFVNDVLPSVDGEVEAIVCAPYTALAALAPLLKGSLLKLGAQNMHWENEGAYTGEISPLMLKELAVTHVIIGHSERRQYFAETDETVNRKVKAACSHGLVPIVCVGEDLAVREGGTEKELVKQQVVRALAKLSSQEASLCVIAYEPVWAIGTGKAATPDDAQEMCAFIRQVVADAYDQQVANQVKILYGGSVKPDNIAAFFMQRDIDGALVGGASVKADSFVRLLAAARGEK